MSKTTCWD